MNKPIERTGTDPKDIFIRQLKNENRILRAGVVAYRKVLSKTPNWNSNQDDIDAIGLANSVALGAVRIDSIYEAAWRDMHDDDQDNPII